MSRNRYDDQCVCGWPLDEAQPVGPLLSEQDYLTEVGQLRYLGNSGHGWMTKPYLYGPASFQKIVCPICYRVYAGWMGAREPGLVPDQLFDSSFYHAFNDEPAPEDEPLTHYHLHDILQAWVDAGRPRKNGAT